jgi:hypothetical protein
MPDDVKELPVAVQEDGADGACDEGAEGVFVVVEVEDGLAAVA